MFYGQKYKIVVSTYRTKIFFFIVINIILSRKVHTNRNSLHNLQLYSLFTKKSSKICLKKQ